MRRVFALMAASLAVCIGASRVVAADASIGVTPPGLFGAWHMTRLACMDCKENGTLPPDYAGGEITIGPKLYDDPLAGSCPGPSFATEAPKPLVAFLQATHLAASPGLSGANASVLRILVTCRAPPNARVPAGAVVTLDLVSTGILVRTLDSDAVLVLTRSPH